MKDNFCDVTIVLDRSGSMRSVHADTIGGFNTFIEDQRKPTGECTISLVQFDNEYQSVYDAKPIKEAPLLDGNSFVPRGGTALLDAIGRAINATGERLRNMDDEARPSKVLFVILTDGGENASKEFTRAQVFEMIGHQKSVYQWDFVFIGANQDAIQVGASLNITAKSSISYAANSAGTISVFESAGEYMGRLRSAGSASFTAYDRQKQTDAGL